MRQRPVGSQGPGPVLGFGLRHGRGSPTQSDAIDDFPEADVRLVILPHRAGKVGTPVGMAFSIT